MFVNSDMDGDVGGGEAGAAAGPTWPLLSFASRSFRRRLFPASRRNADAARLTLRSIHTATVSYGPIYLYLLQSGKHPQILKCINNLKKEVCAIRNRSSSRADRPTARPMGSGNHRLWRFVAREVLLLQCRTAKKKQGRRDKDGKRKMDRWKGNRAKHYNSKLSFHAGFP